MADLEARIDRLETTQERGDAFEVFAEAYIATQRLRGAVEVWPESEIPIELKIKHGLNTPRDMGVDGAYQLSSGDIVAYQVKYRGSRRRLRWGDELATFMGQTDQVSERLLFTNSDALPPIMEERTNFIPVLGHHLDQLGSDDFEAIEHWLRGRKVYHVIAKPRPHQQRALDGIGDALSKHNRTTALMACGTGKTLIGLWVAEQQKAKTVLVLVPSLALVNQTLHEWAKHTSWDSFNCLCVCSDQSVTRKRGDDDWALGQADLDFKVTTDPDVVLRFLKGPEKHKVILSTYQSSQVVADALPPDFKFDLGLFDEAHKTAGREGTKFSFALRDDNLAIDKRVFMTATPRHYDVSKRDKEGDAKLVYSMDTRDYGVRGFTLPFSEAADEGIISRYKVIISVVTDEMLDAEMRRTGQVIVDGDAIHAQQVANQVALRKAVEQFGVKRIFSFHRNIASAKSFVEDGLIHQLPDFQRLHIDGGMPVNRRNNLLKQFKQADRALISNARCLTEGVDVPAVDMVAFMSPKKSTIDIVQAAGRAMRKSDDKKVGFILLPVYLQQNLDESLESAIQRSRFTPVWDVLSALQEQDDVIAESIRQLREDKGAKKGYDDGRLRERVEVIGPEIGLDEIRRAISLEIVDRLSSSWDERFGALCAFSVEYGHCDVPSAFKDGLNLAEWTFRQRYDRKIGRLRPDREGKLSEIGFNWDVNKSLWEDKFVELCEFIRKHNHCMVPQDYSYNPGLGRWVRKQRINYASGSLAPDKIRRLERVGFVWNVKDEAWRRMFQKLSDFHSKHGTADVPRNWEEDAELGRWVNTQRNRLKRGTILEEEIGKLNSLGFEWNPLDAHWDKMYASLIDFSSEHGHCRVPRGSKEYGELSAWVSSLRSRRKKLSAEKIARLAQAGFSWDPKSEYWRSQYEQLLDFHKHHGHSNVILSDDRHGTLGKWVQRQRHAFKAGSLDASKIQLLNELDFEFDPLEARWEARFAEFVQYQIEHGHGLVPDKDPIYKELAHWVAQQREYCRKSKLTKARRERLNKIGFIWDVRAHQWDQSFRALLEFRENEGHCNVPQGWPQNRKLANWVKHQRRKRSEGNLEPDRITKLEAIGFEWSGP